jgi:glycogen debranching enzyme
LHSLDHFSPNHYWRGNVWLVFNWLRYKGLRRYGYFEEAGHITERSLALAEASGFYEYFNPLTGKGCGLD